MPRTHHPTSMSAARPSATPSLEDARWAAVVELETAAGKRLRRQVDATKGDPDNPLSPEELRTKFRGLVSRVVDDETTERLITRLEALTDLEHISDVLEDVKSTATAGVLGDG